MFAEHGLYMYSLSHRLSDITWKMPAYGVEPSPDYRLWVFECEINGMSSMLWLQIEEISTRYVTGNGHDRFQCKIALASRAGCDECTDCAGE